MRLGVIGGLGPMATAWFLQLVISMTEAACDQDHLDMILYNTPSIPDRTAFILGKSDDDPAPAIIRVGKSLKEQGADILAIPCMTAHYFHARMQEEIGLPVLHGIRCTAQLLRENGISRAGVMATDGAIRTQLFQQELKCQGIEALLPSSEGQEAVMRLIYEDIKANRPPRMELVQLVKEEFRARGAECIILGCTELSVIKTLDQGGGFADAMEILARSAVLACGKPIRKEYQNLITALR